MNYTDETPQWEFHTISLHHGNIRGPIHQSGENKQTPQLIRMRDLSRIHFSVAHVSDAVAVAVVVLC
jgi:hypothetical protein